jgi:hypothetical protein
MRRSAIAYPIRGWVLIGNWEAIVIAVRSEAIQKNHKIRKLPDRHAGPGHHRYDGSGLFFLRSAS